MRRTGESIALFAVLTLAPAILFAAATPTNQLLTQRGAGSNFGHGDFVSNASGGPNTYQSYFIEVPPATGNLTVDVFDADVGLSGGGDVNDRPIGGAWDTGASYSLRDPSGATVVTRNLGSQTCGAFGACDNLWSNLYTTANPAAGHWELRVDMSSGVTNGDDVNGYGLRAHDGNTGSGGTELNVYAPTYALISAFAGASRTL